jgi:hypothetical protein
VGENKKKKEILDEVILHKQPDREKTASDDEIDKAFKVINKETEKLHEGQNKIVEKYEETGVDTIKAMEKQAFSELDKAFRDADSAELTRAFRDADSAELTKAFRDADSAELTKAFQARTPANPGPGSSSPQDARSDGTNGNNGDSDGISGDSEEDGDQQSGWVQGLNGLLKALGAATGSNYPQTAGQPSGGANRNATPNVTPKPQGSSQGGCKGSAPGRAACGVN